MWWAWAGFTFYANRFDTDDVVYRLAKLGAMLAVAGLAASATDATGSGRTVRVLPGRHPPDAGRSTCMPIVSVAQARGLIVVYLTAGALPLACGWPGRCVGAGPVRCLGGRGGGRAAAPVVATRRSAGLPCIEHLPERLGSTPSIRLLFQGQQFRRQPP